MATAAGAVVFCGAFARQIAGRVVGGELATHPGIAGIGGTGIGVIAGQVGSAHAASQLALITGGADIPVVARRLVHGEGATCGGITGIIGAGIVVVARSSAGEGAEAVAAQVSGGARIAVVTRGRIGGMLAPCFGAAEVVGAEIAVVTGHGRARQADAVCALVVDGTIVAIVTASGVGGVDAAAIRVARIICAGIAIVAVGGVAGGTGAAVAGVRGGTRVAVVASPALVVGYQGTGSRGRVALGHQAGGIGPRRCRAGDDGSGNDLALVGQLVGVAKEGAIAQVVVFEGLAIGIDETIACDLCAATDALLTMVAHGAGILIVAVSGYGRIAAAPRFGADIVGTGILIFADYRVTGADALGAVVGDGTGVGVTAILFVGDFVDASLLAAADVFGAIVVIEAEVNEVTVDEIGLINVTIAIVVQPITDFGRWCRGITAGQPGLNAGALAGAGAKVVADSAGSAQTQGNRAFGAGTDTGVVDALLECCAGTGGAFLTRKSPWTIAIFRTLPPTKGALVPIVKAGIFGTANAGAVAAGGTGATEVGVVGDADEDQVGVGSCHLLATPPRGTFFLAGNGADLLTQVLNAPAGLAVTVLVAGVEEAALTRVAKRCRRIGA
jgi:hypothetical protein